MSGSERYEPPEEALDEVVYVNRESQKYHESERCSGDSASMSLREAFYAHNPCRNCCTLYTELGGESP